MSTQFGYEGKQNDDTPTAQQDLQWLIDLFIQDCPLPDYRYVFNPGAGAGAETALLRDYHYKPIGYTLGHENVVIAKERYGITLIEQDMHMPGFNDESFDAIFTVQTCEHALSMHIMMLEFWRILRTGGRWFLDTATQNEGMWQVWHSNLHSHDEWLKYGEVYGFKLFRDHSEVNRTTMTLEKIPLSECVNAKYLQQLYSALSKATNGE